MAQTTEMGVREVAKAARVSEQSVRSWVKRGRLTPRKGENGRLVFDEAQVQEFVASRKQGRRPGRPSTAESRERMAKAGERSEDAVRELRTATRKAVNLIREQQAVIQRLNKRLEEKETQIRGAKRAMLARVEEVLNEQR